MRPAALLAHARSLGARLSDADGRLVVERAEGPLPDAVLAALRSAKEEVLRLLAIEATRPMPCPCGPCTEAGVAPHGPRCYCGPCLDVDPTWEEWRAQADAEEAMARADAAYEVEERLAIQAEGCTAAEIAAQSGARQQRSGADEGQECASAGREGP